MKARVNTFLNIRTRVPEVLPDNNPNDLFFKPGDVIDIAEAVKGEKRKGNDIWYRLDDGTFVWSGGVEKITFTENFISPVKLEFPPAQVTNWNVSIPQIPDQWVKMQGKGIKIAVLDTGIFEKHPDLSNAILDYEDFTLIKDKIDYDGHGTHVAGIIGARSASAKGIIGVAPLAHLICLKVLPDGNDGGELTDYQNIIDALDKAVAKGADIINMSLSLKRGNDLNENEQMKVTALRQKIKDISDKNIIIVAAAGDNKNLEKKNLFFPAECEGVISVASINEGYFDRHPDFSEKLNIAGPTINYTSTFKEPLLYERLGGCSMTSAFVSGIIALAIASERKTEADRFSKEEILSFLNANSLKLAEMNYSNPLIFNYHLLNI